MSVNPKLAALMRIIEENQDKISEGEYLEAMNALGSLHREVPPPPPPMHAPIQPGVNPNPNPNPNPGAVQLFRPTIPECMVGQEWEYQALARVQKYHPDRSCTRISPTRWMGLEYASRFRLLREAVECFVHSLESTYAIPEPSACPFISRHAVGHWNMNGDTEWECVCGYTGKTKHWKKHEESERHQDWAKHRTVSRKKVDKMKARINDDEAGDLHRFASRIGMIPDGVYPGGIRTYIVTQDRNEWTHPELYLGPHRSESGTWVVHPRACLAREYVQ